MPDAICPKDHWYTFWDGEKITRTPFNKVEEAEAQYREVLDPHDENQTLMWVAFHPKGVDHIVANPHTTEIYCHIETQRLENKSMRETLQND